MSNTLDDLFKQIIQSEQRAQERKTFLNEVKTDIEKCQQKLVESEEELGALRGQMILKTQHLKNEELKLKWLTSRETILKAQVDDHSGTVESLKEKLIQSKEKLASSYDQFCSNAREFNKGYSLIENGKQIRETESRNLLAALQTEKTALEQELKSFNREKENLAKLEEMKNQTQANLNSLLSEEDALKKQLGLEEKKLQAEENEKRRVSDIPMKDPEFVRLQKELDTAREINPEKKCLELQQELQQLQQTLWQRQLKRGSNLPKPKQRKIDKPQSHPYGMGNVMKVTNFPNRQRQDEASQSSLITTETLQKQQKGDADFSSLFVDEF